MKFDPSAKMHVPPDTETIHDIAKFVASKGYAVLPVRGKVVTTPNGVYDATTDPDVIDRWPKNTTGYAAAVPDGMVVVDVDPRHGGDKWLAEHEHMIPETATVHTGGGGWHIWFKAEPGLRYPGQIKGEGVDFRQSGNYVLMPGSAHDSGGSYGWYNNVDAAPVPEFIEAFARQRQDTERSTGEASPWLAAESKLTAEQRSEAANKLTDNMIDGCKHAAVRSFGGWANGRGIPWADTEWIIRDALEQRADVKSVEAGVSAARWAYVNGVTVGWAEMYESLDNAVKVGQLLERSIPDFHALAGGDIQAKLAARKAAAEAAPTDAQEALDALGPRYDLRAPIPEDEFVVADLPWHTGVVNGLIGYPGSGKSPLAATLAASWAYGVPWLDCKVVPGRVLVVCFEASKNMARAVQRSLNVVGYSKGGAHNAHEENLITVLPAPCGSLHDPKYLATVRAAAAGFKYVILDTYGSGATGVDQNESGFATPLKELEIDGVCTLVIMHTKKGQGVPNLEAIAGTSASAGALKGAAGISRPDPTTDTFTLNWVRGGTYFADKHFKFHDAPNKDKSNPTFGLYVKSCDAVVPDKGEQKETVYQIRDRVVGVIETVVIPRMKTEDTWRPTLAEIAVVVGAAGAKEKDILRREITSMKTSGVLHSNPVEGITRYYPA